jgi:hypothetical protein
MRPAANRGLHLEPNTCRLGDRRNYSNIDVTIDSPYLCNSWTMATVESIAFRQGREFANSLHSSFVALLDLRTTQPRSVLSTSLFLQPYVRSPDHTLFTALARARQTKQAT